MDININIRRSRLSRNSDGQSGPGIRPRALLFTWKVASAGLGIPIFGGGGVWQWQDPIKFVMVGATAVPIGTAHMSNPNFLSDIIVPIKYFLDERNLSIMDLIGTVVPY